MKPIYPGVLALTVLALCGACSPPTSSDISDTGGADTSGAASRAVDAPPPAAAATRYQSQPWALPAPVGAAQPDLVATADGRLLLSWIEPDPAGGHALRFSTFGGVSEQPAARPANENPAIDWTEPATIASGDDWFVNWADTPHIAMTNDGALWAHWLQKSAAAPYAYDVALVRSADGGGTWSAPVLVNDDATATEHGFVSLWPQGDAGLGVAWLDGRQTAGDSHGGHGQHTSDADDAGEQGAMSLRSARFDAAGTGGALRKSADTRIDAMTCDCCQTTIALTSRGPLLAYRDRTAAEIRDIGVTRLENGHWTAPHIVHPDLWEMPACPVNGPSIAASGEHVVVGWYTSRSTATGDIPTLKIAYSGDAGDAFAPPITLDQGDAVQGRVAVALDDNSAWVVWVREDAQGQSLQLARYSPGLERELQRVELAKIAGRGRATGFPKIALVDGRVHVVWTEVTDGAPRLHGAVMGR